MGNRVTLGKAEQAHLPAGLNMMPAQVEKIMIRGFMTGRLPERKAAPKQKRMLGEFEYIVLLAISRLGSEAFGARISDFLINQTKRDIALAQTYVSLGRLENKGLVVSRNSEPKPERGGRSRRIFELEDLGASVLRENMAFRLSLINAHIGDELYEHRQLAETP